ncbi:MAG: hypothetical protein ACXABY_10595 [Candidatus Thorarchaeota archaeon]|jgi:hypothetical protein
MMFKAPITALYCDNAGFKRQFLSQWEFYAKQKDLTWLMGIACYVNPKIERKPFMMDIMVFQDGLDFYRKQGIAVTREKVLLHELQHVAMFRKGLKAVEPYSCLAEEYGIIDGMRPPEKYIIIKPHWSGVLQIPKIAFYSHATIEGCDITWQYRFKD